MHAAAHIDQGTVKSRCNNTQYNDSLNATTKQRERLFSTAICSFVTTTTLDVTTVGPCQYAVGLSLPAWLQ